MRFRAKSAIINSARINSAIINSLKVTGKFLKYFTAWKISIAAGPGEFTDNARANMFISWQTYEGIQITVHSSIELIKYLLIQGVQYVLTERFCQDSLENYFGRQRSMGRRKDNPSLCDCWKLLEIAGTKTPNLLRLMWRLCHVGRAIENKINQNTLKKCL